jgi:hypothetical protein
MCIFTVGVKNSIQQNKKCSVVIVLTSEIVLWQGIKIVPALQGTCCLPRAPSCAVVRYQPLQLLIYSNGSQSFGTGIECPVHSAKYPQFKWPPLHCMFLASTSVIIWFSQHCTAC